MAYRGLTAAFLVVLWLVTVGCATGSPSSQYGAPPGLVKEIQVTLSEFKIDSPVVDFSAGVSYRFYVENAGAVSHEFMIMPRSSKKPNEALAYIAEDKLPAKGSKSLDYKFKKPGDFEFSCLLTGHYEDGMVLAIVVK